MAPATVYAVAGGKQVLIRTLVDLWSQAPIVAESVADQEELDDPDEILRRAAAVVATMRQDYRDTMRLVMATAPHNDVRANLETAIARYRQAIRAVGTRLHEVGGLGADVSVHQATDILRIYFVYSGYFTVVDDNGWSCRRAEQWLLDQASSPFRDPG